MTDNYYYYEYPKWESPYAVNYSPSQISYFVSNGIKLHRVDDEQIKQLGKTKVYERHD